MNAAHQEGRGAASVLQPDQPPDTNQQPTGDAIDSYPSTAHASPLPETYPFDADGALCREYLLERGYCCRLGCRNCPYHDEED